MRTVLFPQGFVWGAASSALQIEGASSPSERGESIWDTFSRREGCVLNGDNVSIACDHIARMPSDVALLKQIGLKAYRFSVSWPRVMPDGVGALNTAGLDFYDRLVDELLAAGIAPWLTLYHWELPQSLFNRGGWLNRSIVSWFAEYTEAVAAKLGDRVKHWMTLNEPQVFLVLGMSKGIHAPGLKLSTREVLLATHHALMAHGRAVQVIRAQTPVGSKVGWAPVGKVDYPATDTAADIAAARRVTFAIEKPELWNNTWYADPVCLGQYPEDGLRAFGGDVPRITPGDMEIIRQPLDFYGLNIYAGTPTRATTEGGAAVAWPAGHARNALNWPVAPPSLRWGPRFIWERYKLPIVITENGMTNLDWVDLDGRVRDPQRIDYTRRYLFELAAAIDDGVPVQGYFHWSAMDNFEWAEGYKDRFGLIHVDFATQKRTLKDSAYWYRGVIRSNGQALTLNADDAMQLAEPTVVSDVEEVSPRPAVAVARS